ncbi:phage tail spike protein [Staphylococcus haemolyticus]|uniref:phage tail spike protein n=1 Tax=Staphylococcus haemolyticus TaxID=1283 RepID=UPI0015D77966|nr:phage tail spike protein [Staphylococcus haemolyticus]
MKNVGIHVLDFNDNIIDFISQSDGALINVEMSMNVEEKTETFDFTIENTRAEKLRERNRIIAQDNNGTFREFIIIHIADNFDGTTEIECNASYLEDLKTAKPIKPGKFETHTTTQALLKTLADTGWEVSDDTEYSGNRTTSWTSHTNPFDLIYMLCTTYDMVPSFYIELGAHTVEHRYVSITKPKNLFKGKEITKGKDLTGMTRTIDLSEVKTALLAIGPEKEDGSRIETVITDDEAQQIFGLPNRYIWDVYEPESNDENMTLKRLTTLAKTELNKRNQAAISYEVSSLDIHKYYNDVTVHLRDIVRVKDRDFRPPLYIEAEVIGIKYNWLADESEFTFGNVIEYEETKLREFFNKRLDEITKKLNDNFSNVHTIVSDVVAGEMEYYERKIFKGAEPPENPQNDTLWYDTSNSDVAVLRRYWNGKWITQTADDVEKIGGLRREQVMYRDLNNSFINLTIQHSKLQNDVYDVLNNEYLVDDDLKANLNQALSDVDSVYQNIKTNLDSMDEDTATIGKLVDTQTLFTVYREKLQTLYKYVTDAKISIDKRLKLLQSQYTDEKFNEALTKVANKFGLTVDSNNNMVGAPDVIEKAIQASRIDTQEQLKSYVKSVDYKTDKDGIVERLDSADSERLQLSNEIKDKVSVTEYNSGINEAKTYTDDKMDNLSVGGRNYFPDEYLEYGTFYSDTGNPIPTPNPMSRVRLNLFIEVESNITYNFKCNNPIEDKGLKIDFFLFDKNKVLLRQSNYQDFTDPYRYIFDDETKFIKIVFKCSDNSTILPDEIKNAKIKMEKGKVTTDWTPAPENTEKKLSVMNTEINQNGREIRLKASQQDFNASRKTLSQVISEISATTKGINLSYDENGNIQSYTMDRNGIQLRGDKVDITINKDFNVMASRVDDKVGKGEIINRLNLSPEGLDINVNNIGIRGGDSVDYLDIRNNSILSYGSFTRTWANETDTANLRLGIQGGTVKVQNRTTGYNLYLTEKGLSTMLAGAGDETAGTLEFHSTKYNDTSRGVRLHSTYGAVALESDYSRIILNANLTVNIESNYSIYFRPYRDNRTGNNEFAMYVKQNDSGAYTDGVLKYGNVSSDTSQYGSGIRFSKSSINSTIYATNKDGDIGTGHFFADKLYGDLTAKGSNAYILVDDALRITDKKGYNNGNVKYKDLQCLDVQANSIRVNTAKDFYIGVSTGELRVTNNLLYNRGDTGYKDIRFANWHAMSSEKFKYDIKEWNYSVLDAFRNDLRLYSYKLNSEKETNYARNHHGIIIEREIPIEWRHGDGFDGNEVMFWNTKAIQELIKKVDKLEEQLNEQSITS